MKQVTHCHLQYFIGLLYHTVDLDDKFHVYSLQRKTIEAHRTVRQTFCDNFDANRSEKNFHLNSIGYFTARHFCALYFVKSTSYKRVCAHQQIKRKPTHHNERNFQRSISTKYLCQFETQTHTSNLLLLTLHNTHDNLYFHIAVAFSLSLLAQLLCILAESIFIVFYHSVDAVDNICVLCMLFVSFCYIVCHLFAFVAFSSHSFLFALLACECEEHWFWSSVSRIGTRKPWKERNEAVDVR